MRIKPRKSWETQSLLEKGGLEGRNPSKNLFSGRSRPETEVREGLRHSEALRAAARSDQGGFAVPKVMEGE